MNVLIAITLSIALFLSRVEAAKSITVGRGPVHLSVDPQAAPEAKILNQKLWESQFSQGMKNHPDAFRENAFMRYYGVQGAAADSAASINDSILRYGKNFPGTGSGFSLLEEFAKNVRQWDGGIEQRKSIAAGIINYCPDCMGRFASDTYSLLIKQKRGESLTPDEKSIFATLNGQIGKGVFKNVDASWRELAAGANPNDSIIWQGESMKGLFNELSRLNRDQYQLLIKDSERFRSFIGARIGTLEGSMEREFSEIRAKLSHVDQKNQSESAREQYLAGLERQLNDLQVGTRLAASLLTAANRAPDAQRLLAVSNAALSVYDMVVRRAKDETQVSQFAVAATSLNAIVIVASLMQDQVKKSDTQYVLEALAGLSEQMEKVSVDVQYIRRQMNVMSTEIDNLRRRNEAQYGALYSKISSMQNAFADERLSRWAAERSRISTAIKRSDVQCKAIAYEADGVDFEKANPQLQSRFRDRCLSPLLAILTVEVSSARVLGPTNSSLSGGGAFRLFNLSFQRDTSPELWYPLLGDELPLSRNPTAPLTPLTGAANLPVSVAGSGGAPLANPIDLELWREAMNAYAYAILRWPTYIPRESRPEDKIILELESQTVARANQIQHWLNQRLSTDRFNAAVESYRESGLAVLRALKIISTSFVEGRLRSAWCNDQSVAERAKDLGTDEAQWLLHACEQHANGVIQLSERTHDTVFSRRWTSDATIFPIGLLLFRDEFRTGAKRLSGEKEPQKLSVSDGRKFSRDELELIAGLRQIDSAVFVLQQLVPDPPHIRRRDSVKVVKPNIPSRDDNWNCLQRTVRTRQDGDLEWAMKVCTRQARQGCVEIKETLPLGISSYKICDGSIDFPDAQYKSLRTSDDFKDKWTKLIEDESIARNIQASRSAFILRRNGLRRELVSPQVSSANHTVQLKGINARGVPEVGGVVRKPSVVDNFKFQFEEEFEVAQADKWLSAIGNRLDALQVELTKHLKTEDSPTSLRPLYDQLNRSYASLMLHTFFYLQMDASDTQALKVFVRMPISGEDIAESIARGAIPKALGQRLLLADDTWFKGLPTLEGFETASDRMTSRDCAPDGRDIRRPQPPRMRYELNLRANTEVRSELAEDVYCKMWEEQVARLSLALPKVQPVFTGVTTYAFNRGSLFLSDGLDAWARISNERALRKRLQSGR